MHSVTANSLADLVCGTGYKLTQHIHIKKIKFHHKMIVFDQAIGNDEIHEAKVKKQPL